ncbi:MAG: hypothetical protein GOV00_00185 [Candidatus Altiarchaeota archaeon]|nr:hypothetical protein [Candidatus Altiarchaeota archaeon]
MGLIDKGNEMLGKLDIIDVKLACLGKAALALMIAKLWPPLLSLEWYWYLVAFVVLYAKAFKKMFL